MWLSSSANSMTASIRSAIVSGRKPSDDANRVTFSRPVSSGWNPCPTASRGSTRPQTRISPPVGTIVPARI